MPAVLTVRDREDAELDLVWLARLDRVAPARGDALEIVGVDEFHRAASDHVGAGWSAGDLGEVRQGQLAEDGAQRLVEGSLVVAGVRPDAGGERHPTAAAERDVDSMVQEPTTRVPS